MTGAPQTVRAAGGVVWRSGDGGALEVLLVHRPKYDDWSLPKGKCDPGETEDACALREVEEETGFRCERGSELPSTSYIDHNGRPKTVRYWTMTVTSGTFAANEEIDEVRWLPVDQAASLLSYERDRDLLRSLGSPRG